MRVRIALLFLVALCTTGHSIPSAAAGDLIIIDSRNGLDTISTWRAITAEEFDVVEEEDGTGLTRHVVSPPAPVGAIVHEGLVIPLEELAYIFPSLGIYVTRGGHHMVGRPLYLAALERQHKHIDIDRQRKHLADHEDSPLETRLEPRFLFLNVRAEYPVKRSIAGYPTEEVAQRSLQGAHAVIFDAAFLDQAREELTELTRTQSLRAPEAGETRIPHETLILYRHRGGGRAASIEPGSRLSVVESDSLWCRVSLEGWIPLADWIRAGIAGRDSIAEAPGEIDSDR